MVEQKAMLGKFIELVDLFNDLTNGVFGNVCGPVKDVANKICGPDGYTWRQQFALWLRKEPCWVDKKPRKWIIDDEGNIHFTVTSNGMTKHQWDVCLKFRGFRLLEVTRNVLLQAEQLPTNDVTYHIVVRPNHLISQDSRFVNVILAYASRRGWRLPHWEIACLIRDAFSDEDLEEMGLFRIVVMHEPIMCTTFTAVHQIPSISPWFLLSSRDGEGRQLTARKSIAPDDLFLQDGSAFVEFIEETDRKPT